MGIETNPDRFKNRRITNIEDFQEIIEPLLRVLFRNYLGIEESIIDEDPTMLESWRSYGHTEAENPNSYLSIFENQARQIVGGIIARGLKSGDENCKKAEQAEIDPNQVLYISNLAFDPKGQGLGTKC